MLQIQNQGDSTTDDSDDKRAKGKIDRLTKCFPEAPIPELCDILRAVHQEGTSNFQVEKIAVDNPTNMQPLGDPHPHLQKKQETCALIGNSGSLRKTLSGDEIDKHDAVMRMNSIATAEKLVKDNQVFLGSKITYRSHNLNYQECHHWPGEVGVENSCPKWFITN